MKARARTLSLLVALSFCLSLLPSAPAAIAQEVPLAPTVSADEPWIEYAPGVVLVKLRGVALQNVVNAASGEATVAVAGDAPMLAASLLAFGASSVEPLYAQPEVSAAGIAETTYRVTLRPDADVPMAAQAMAVDPAVAWAEPDYIARAAAPLALTPNDPDLAQQWAIAKIGAPAAWDLTTGSTDVIIAFIDSGIDTAHEEFAGRLWVNDDAAGGGDNDSNGFVDDMNGWNFVTKSANIADSSGHGTQVAGVAGAASNNAKGIAGICWQCRLMIVTAMQPSGAANYSDIAEAVKYASSNGAQVINISLGGYADSQVLRDAIAEASVTALVVAGAGNDDSASPFYPAAYAQVLAVAATDADDKKPVFSNYGQWVDVSAPGAAIRTPTLGANAYVSGDGTSLSTAFVSGLAGLLKSRNPGWTPEQVRWQIVNTSASIDAANPTYAGQLGTGRINAQAALATTPQPRLELVDVAVDGVANARPAPGQSFQLVVTLKNTWLPASNLNATLTSADPYVSIPDAAGAFGALPSGQTGSNSGDPFGVTLAGNTPYSRNLAFTLNLTGSGGFVASVPLVVQVRSSTFVLGNTQYTTATVTTPDETVLWTNDKTYVLDGSVIVGKGVTLTVQPGTLVKVAPDKFIRIDGTLIADGTAEQPIVFTWKTEGQAPWGGIQFSAGAIGSQLAPSGDYLTGSILRYMHIGFASTAAALGVPVLVSHSFIHDNTAGISGGIPRVEFSLFEANEIGLWPAPGALAVDNTFRNNVSGIQYSGKEGRTFLRNVFQGNRSFGIEAYVDCWYFGGCDPSTISGNVFSANGTGIFIMGPIGTITGNLFQANKNGAISLQPYEISTAGLIAHNTVLGNMSFGIRGGGAFVDIRNNNLVQNGETDLSWGIQAGSKISAITNFWGVPAAQMETRVPDCTSDENGCGAGSTKGEVLWDPPLTAPEQDAPAYVTGVTMSPNPVGLQRGTLTVNFSRAMTTAIAPILSFAGPSYTDTEPLLFDNAQWSSPNSLSGTFDFTPLVPRGTYTVAVAGAIDTNGFAAPAAPYTFTVDYAGGVTTLPPLPPAVQATASASLTSLSAAWQPNGAGITQYRYAIGTTPGARDVVGWTYLTATSVTRGGLNLVKGKTYYVTVQARNVAGLWSVNAVSNAVVAGTPTQGPPTATPTQGPPTATPTQGVPTATPLPGATPTPLPPGSPKVFLPTVKH